MLAVSSVQVIVIVMRDNTLWGSFCFPESFFQLENTSRSHLEQPIYVQLDTTAY